MRGMPEPYRIICVSDPHGSLDRLELLLEFTAPDLYIIAGDLIYNPFLNYKDMEAFYGVQAEVRGWRGRPAGIALPLWLRSVYDELDAERRKVVDRYRELARKARRGMQRQYRALERMRALRPRVPVFFLPGNYDLDLSETALAPYSLHRRVVRTPAGFLGGFGGAPVFTPGIPEHLAVKFREDRPGPGARSEPLQVLDSLDPDIAVTHVPPLGILDGSPTRAFGSWGVAEYLERAGRLKLLLTGHVHGAWGVKRTPDRRWVVNAGNFGPVVEAGGYRRGGYFAEVEFAPAEGVRKVLFKRLERSKIWHLADYTPDPDGGVRESVVEPKRTRDRRDVPVIASEREAAGEGDEFDVAELELYNQIKLFLRRFETIESEARIDDLRELVRRARDRGTEIAFDVLGSLNVGQSTSSSDIDAVLYYGDDPGGNRERPEVWDAFVGEVTEGRYRLDVTDAIDLWEVQDAIRTRDAANEALQRFVVYRTIGRPVNVRLLRAYDDMLLEAGDLRRRVQEALRADLRAIAGTYRHTRSFEKYLERLREMGVRIPRSVQKRIHRYLHGMDA